MSRSEGPAVNSRGRKAVDRVVKPRVIGWPTKQRDGVIGVEFAKLFAVNAIEIIAR